MNDYRDFFVRLLKKLEIDLFFCFLLTMVVRIVIIVTGLEIKGDEYENVIRIVIVGILVLMYYIQYGRDSNVLSTVIYGICGGIIVPMSCIVVFYLSLSMVMLLTCSANYYVAKHNLYEAVCKKGLILVLTTYGICLLYNINMIFICLLITLYIEVLPRLWEKQELETNFYRETDFKKVYSNYSFLILLLFIIVGFSLRYWYFDIDFFELSKGLRI